MDPLEKLISYNQNFAIVARVAFEHGKTDICYKILAVQLNFLIYELLVLSPEIVIPSETTGG